jgi:hypothetical protein
VSQIDYDHDLVSNRIEATYAPSGEATTWTYDRSYQLKREQHSGTSPYYVTYTYDPVGNRLTQQEAGQVTTYAYDVANQLLSEQSSPGVTTYSYDEDGTGPGRKHRRSSPTTPVTRIAGSLMPSR